MARTSSKKYLILIIVFCALIGSGLVIRNNGARRIIVISEEKRLVKAAAGVNFEMSPVELEEVFDTDSWGNSYKVIKIDPNQFAIKGKVVANQGKVIAVIGPGLNGIMDTETPPPTAGLSEYQKADDITLFISDNGGAKSHRLLYRVDLYTCHSLLSYLNYAIGDLIQIAKT